MNSVARKKTCPFCFKGLCTLRRHLKLMHPEIDKEEQERTLARMKKINIGKAMTFLYCRVELRGSECNRYIVDNCFYRHLRRSHGISELLERRKIKNTAKKFLKLSNETSNIDHELVGEKSIVVKNETIQEQTNSYLEELVILEIHGGNGEYWKNDFVVRYEH